MEREIKVANHSSRESSIVNLKLDSEPNIRKLALSSLDCRVVLIGQRINEFNV